MQLLGYTSAPAPDDPDAVRGKRRPWPKHVPYDWYGDRDAVADQADRWLRAAGYAAIEALDELEC